MSGARLGVFLPTFCNDRRRSGRELGAFTHRAEALGSDSVWVTDDLLHRSVAPTCRRPYSRACGTTRDRISSPRTRRGNASRPI
jgi:hypothetical protein